MTTVDVWYATCTYVDVVRDDFFAKVDEIRACAPARISLESRASKSTGYDWSFFPDTNKDLKDTQK